MTDLELVLIVLFLFGLLQGLAIGFILWAPNGNFKQGLMDGITLKFLWGRK